MHCDNMTALKNLYNLMFGILLGTIPLVQAGETQENYTCSEAIMKKAIELFGHEKAEIKDGKLIVTVVGKPIWVKCMGVNPGRPDRPFKSAFDKATEEYTYTILRTVYEIEYIFHDAEKLGWEDEVTKYMSRLSAVASIVIEPKKVRCDTCIFSPEIIYVKPFQDPMTGAISLHSSVFYVTRINWNFGYPNDGHFLPVSSEDCSTAGYYDDLKEFFLKEPNGHQ